jgi:hypothetical protein
MPEFYDDEPFCMCRFCAPDDDPDDESAAGDAEAEAWAPADTGPRELTDWERDLIAPYVDVIPPF